MNKAIEIHPGPLDREDPVQNLLDNLRRCQSLQSQEDTARSFYKAVKMEKRSLDCDSVKAYADRLREQAMEMRADAGHLDRAADEIEKMLEQSTER